MKKGFSILLSMFFIAACSPVSKHALRRHLQKTEAAFQDHIGFALYDLEKEKTLFDYNAATYFTPASNTKIFTFYAALKIIGDSIPGLMYVDRGDSVIFWGTGDPSFLYKNVVKSDVVYNFLETCDKPLYYSSANNFVERFGPGWSWEDYESSFSVERNAFPIYGNRGEFHLLKNQVTASPRYFSHSYALHESTIGSSFVTRDWSLNKFHFYRFDDLAEHTWEKPFVIDSLMVPALLQDTLHKTVTTIYKPIPPDRKVLMSVPADSLYKVMMQESDNFIAEQLMLVCANILSDSASTEISINYLKNNLINDLPDEPVLRDGSGLSCYNLITPRTTVALWKKIYEQVPRQRLFSMLPAGGQSGTLRNTYQADPPYIYGKTGTLSGVHCLSGFLITKKGKTLIFSYMNQNYTQPTRMVQNEMQLLLKQIHDNY